MSINLNQEALVGTAIICLTIFGAIVLKKL